MFTCALSLAASLTAPAFAAPRPVSRPQSVPVIKTSTPVKHAPVAAFTVVHSFTNADGNTPSGSLLEDLNGNFYGTTESGGANNGGTVYQITPSGTVTTLYSFTGGADGATPAGGLVNLVGNIELGGPMYGTTEAGGANNAGTVFQITTAGVLTTLHSFTGIDGATPIGRLTRSFDGNLYGTTSGGGTGNGTVFKISSSGVFTTLYSFTGLADGGVPVGGLSPSLNGSSINKTLYGTTSTGGAFGGGTIFSISPSGTLTTIRSFAPNTDGAAPMASLFPDVSGNLYGTASLGGSGGAGTVFKITTGGAFTLEYSFPTDASGNNPMGAVPTAPLTCAFNGSLYGTTQAGGANSAGVAFKISGPNAIKILHSFTGADGAAPNGQLVPDTSGNLYGTASSGGTGNGTFFVLPQ